MYALFRMLFQSSYWRMLLRGATWREAGMSLRRAHKDSRARKHVGRVALLALIPFVCVAYLAWLAGSGALIAVPFVIPVIWWRSRREREDAVPLSIVPAARPAVKELSAEELAALRRYFADQALFFAVMLDRAGSESFLKTKELPPGVQVTSRRVHLDLLHQHSLWDRMEPTDRFALMAADGHWEWKQINLAGSAMEPLRLVRWMLRLDFYLPVIGQQLKGNYALAQELVQAPAKLYEATDLIDWSGILTGRDAAHTFYLRCLAEAMTRGHVTPRNDEAAAWAKGVTDRLKGRQDEDFVLETKLVSEASDELLRWALVLSEQRVNFLNWAMKIRESGTVPEKMMGVFRPEAESEEPAAEIVAEA